jgi:hypothetical protein
MGCTRGAVFGIAVAAIVAGWGSVGYAADKLPAVVDAEPQPLLVHVKRLREALTYLGSPLSADASKKLDRAAKAKDQLEVLALVQEALDSRCLFGVTINPESRVKVVPGPAKPTLVQQGWRQFLIKVHNQAGVTAQLKASSPQAASMHNSPKEQLADRWLGLRMFDGRPLNKALSGTKLEYRIVQLYSRDTGKRAAVFAFNVGQGTQDIGFRNDVTITFNATPSQALTLSLLDENGKPTTAAFEIRDRLGRIYPSQAKRKAPDFAFHPQVYRADGESIRLPKGVYSIGVTRGPEYFAQTHRVQMAAEAQTLQIKLKRWVDPSKFGWWSGDHHIHAAGCSHYRDPTQGVHAPDMLRHCLGEDLKIGATLTWGPGFDYQKQFFTGQVDKVSRYPYFIRYDVEVSGFGSHRSGHLCLLRLKEQVYPGGKSKDHWPTLCLNTLKWAKKQGAVVGPAHSGWGLTVFGPELPNYNIPKYNGIGANEYIVDVTHRVPGPDGKLVPAVDFLSMCDTPSVWELNIWYHTLNVGFRTRVSGETDFPCIYGERVGMGRAYVKLDGKLDYDRWCEGIRLGRAYVSDGRSHLMDMTVAGVEVGTSGSEVKLAQPGTVQIKAKVAARLNEKPNPRISGAKYWQKPYWHIERARIDQTRTVPVELIVNGEAVARKTIEADGQLKEITFEVKIEHSSWVALRILPTSHTNPVFVLVGDKPIRASRRSADWCLKSVDQCWSQKKKLIAAGEMKDAIAAYEHARQVYRKRVTESVAD